MTKRREFTAKVRLAIIKRATVEGVIRCEECHCAVARFEVHHRTEDALELDKSAPLTAADGTLLCVPCHSELTRPFQTIIAKVKRVEAKHIGAARPEGKIKSRGFAKSVKPARQTRPAANGVPQIARMFTDN